MSESSGGCVVRAREAGAGGALYAGALYSYGTLFRCPRSEYRVLGAYMVRGRW